MIVVCRVIERDAEPEWGKALSAYERDREAADVRDKGWRDEVAHQGSCSFQGITI